jgi:hypothetical protein
VTENKTASNVPIFPLAVDADGIPLRVPPEAVAWRVRKLAKRAGRPKIIIDPETGRPLEIPLATPYDDFCDQVGEAGRYRLEGIDADGCPIIRCVAVTEVFDDDDTPQPAPPLNSADALTAALQLVGHLVQSHSKVMEAMASAFGQVQPAHPADPVVITQPAPSANAGNPLDSIQQVLEILTGKKTPPPEAAASVNSAAPASHAMQG